MQKRTRPLKKPQPSKVINSSKANKTKEWTSKYTRVWSQELATYKIRGRNYRRIRYGTEPDYIENETKECPKCSCKVGSTHRFGCSLENSCCPIHPGIMISCVCDEEDFIEEEDE